MISTMIAIGEEAILKIEKKRMAIVELDAELITVILLLKEFLLKIQTTRRISRCKNNTITTVMDILEIRIVN